MNTINISRILFLLGGSLICLVFLWCLRRGQAWFIEWELLRLNSKSIIITFTLPWISFIFWGFVISISSLVLYFRGEWIYGIEL